MKEREKKREGREEQSVETDFRLRSWRSGNEKGGEEEMNKDII